MVPTASSSDWASVDIAVPRVSERRPGIAMAGFRQRVPASVDIAMVAHPSVTLLIDLSEHGGLVYDDQGRFGRGSVVVGLLPGALRVSGRMVECLQVRLEPAVAAAVFGGASAEIGGAVTALEDVWGRGARRVEDRLRAAASWDERFSIAARLLAERRQVRVRPRVDPEVVHIWRRTLASRGRVRVAGLADEVGWSRQRLHARFRSQLGIAPKRAARLVRFDHAAHLLAAGRGAGDVAGESGYVDQSHLHREVAAFTGLTPTSLAVAPWLTIDEVAWPIPIPAW